MEALADHGKAVLAEYGVHPYHRIEGAEAGVIHKNLAFGDAGGKKGPFHLAGLVVRGVAVISADHNTIHFAGVVKLDGGSYPVGEVGVGTASGELGRGAEHESRFVVRDVIGAFVAASFGRVRDDTVACEDKRQRSLKV